ncbi:hypothetical protein N7457_002618 [Penicillium paradoxum]|uniref:uncharacterized protein n=1 Tax=Penicillium paradoxum TaxID=176176 RepID=UPI002547F869|nr:uncharacterized protein N7457_002618 [Penicillium paradoxum]KAJ5787628.1 hypothetical protein N7457_002618 [Penicillium paradoxum]
MGASHSQDCVDIDTVLQRTSAHGGDRIYHPRHTADARQTFDILRQRLPAEIVLEILEFAQYWLQSCVQREERISYTESECHDRTAYLKSYPIRGERSPVRQINIHIWSRDQGWSSYREDHGTFKNSWTWFVLDIDRPSGREDISKDEDLRLATNVHAGKALYHHEITYRADQNLRWMKKLQAGDRISVVPRAQFPGWRNIVEKAAIEIYTTPDL